MTCHNCRIVAAKAGKRPDGMQRYRCGQCGKTFSEHKEQNNLFGCKQAVDDNAAIIALTLLGEGSSIRSAERITGIQKKTIMGLLVKAGQRCEALMSTRIQNVPVTDVQCDEIWTFVGKKESRRVDGDKNYEFIGDAWTFIAVERHTKLILAFELARRHTVAATRFMGKIARAAGDERFQLSTDGLAAYNFAVGTKLDGRCDYGQVVKIYTSPSKEEQRRYSPAHIAECHLTPVYGNPNIDKICTSHIERVNGSLRQWCKRLTRLTYAFSKKWENLKAALALHFAYTNFCRVHSTIKKTPAMAAGLTDHKWSMQELLSA